MKLPKDWNLVNKDGNIHIYKDNIRIDFDLKRNLYKVVAGGVDRTVYVTPEIHEVLNIVIEEFQWIKR